MTFLPAPPRPAVRRLPPVLALLAAVGPAARPAEAQVRRDTVRTVEPVVVTGTRRAATVGGAGAVVVRPDSLPMPTQPAPALDQVLRQTPFVLVRQNSRGETELSVRGSDSRQGAVLLDGLPLTLGWDHRTDASLVPANGIQRLTLVRGLSTLLAGPNTLGGVISLQLNAPAQAVAGADGSSGFAPELRFGTGMDQYAARVVSGAGTAPVALGGGLLTLRGGGSYHQRDGFALSRAGGSGDGLTGGAPDPGDADDADLRTNTDLRQVDGFAAVRWDAPSGAHLGVTATAYRARRGVAPELHVEEPRYWRYPEASRRLAILSAGTGDVATPFGRGRVDASVGAHDGDVEIEAFTDRTYATLDSRELGAERTVSGRVTAAHSLPADGRLRVGATLAEVRYDETLDAQLPDAAATRYRQRLSSVGAEAELPLGRLLVSGGVVRDAADTPETGGRPALGALSLWGWRVGGTAAAGDALRLHASASRRARFPALRELYSGALDRFDPNPTLRPERLLGVEAGATVVSEAAARAGLTLQAVAFHHRLDDAVVRVTLPSRLFRRVNRDEIRSTGVELLAGWAPAALRGVSFSGDLLAQRARVHDATLPPGEPDERRPEHQPELRGSLDVGMPLPLGLRGSAAARYTGRQFCQHPDLGRQVELGAQTVGDAAISRSWSSGGRSGGSRLLDLVRATLAVDNLTDATVYDQCGLPQPGRTVRLGIELR